MATRRTAIGGGWAGAAAVLLGGAWLIGPPGAAAQAPGPGDALPSSGCASPAAELPAMLTVGSGGEEREVLLHLPGGSAPVDPVPLVLAFHGYGAGPYDQEYVSELSVLADAKGFVVAYPSGSGDPRQWDLAGDRDTGFAADTLDALEAALCIDVRRVAATGFSMGGGLANVLGCRLSDRIAAIAPVAGVHGPDIGGPCEPTRPVPVIAFHGGKDAAVPYDGGPLPDEVWGGRSASSVESWAAAWADRNGCAAGPEVATISGEVDTLTWSGCRAPVVLYRIPQGEHAWPGGLNDPNIGLSTDDISASELAWAFLEANPLP